VLITFWSPEKGHGRCTSSLLGTACTMAANYKGNSLILGRDGSGEIERAFKSIRSLEVDATLDGIHAVSSLTRAGKLDGDSLKDASTYLIESRLNYLNTLGATTSKFDELSTGILEAASKSFNLIWLDAGR
jgi:hypothetical protein